MGLMDDNQQGFRENRSTADAAQMFIRIHEEASAVVDETCKKDDDPVATLLDITKAYPRINKPCLWTILRKAGMDERTLRTLEGIHEHTHTHRHTHTDTHTQTHTHTHTHTHKHTH